MIWELGVFPGISSILLAFLYILHLFDSAMRMHFGIGQDDGECSGRRGPEGGNNQHRQRRSLRGAGETVPVFLCLP